MLRHVVPVSPDTSGACTRHRATPNTTVDTAVRNIRDGCPPPQQLVRPRGCIANTKTMGDSGVATAPFMQSKPTANDIIGSLAYYFGAPAQPERVKDYSDSNAAVYNFPDAFIGKSTKIQETLSSLINEPQKWPTTVALPLRRVNGTEVEWNEVTFNQMPLDRTPYQATSRLMTMSKRKYRDRLVRRGVALLLESDFFSTPEGQQNFAEQLKSIAQCTQETMNLDVLYKLVSAPHYDLSYTINSLVMPTRQMQQVYKYTVDTFACVQKMDEGFDYLIEKSKEQMSRYRVEPDTLIIPPELSLYLSLVPEQNKVYNIGGPNAPGQFEAGYKGFETRSYRGLGVVVNVPLDSMGTDRADSQALRRTTAVGEYYEFKPHTDGTTPWHEIKIYDEGSDSLQTISLANALKFACTTQVMANTSAKALFTNVAAADMDILEKDDFKAIVAKAKTGDDLGFKVILVRPFITHEMYSCILMKSGGAAGHTCFGESDFQFAANVDVKNIHGHFTAHFNSMVTDPKQVKPLRDVMCANYVSGCSAAFFGDKDAAAADMGESIAKDLMKLRQPHMTQVGLDKSMLAFIVPTGDRATMPGAVISISNLAFPWSDSRGASDGSGMNFPGGKDVMNAYENIIKSGNHGLSSIINSGRNVQAAMMDSMIKADSTLNSFCFPGPYRYPTSSSGSSSGWTLMTGKCHFGSDAVPNDLSWRNGQLKSRKEARANYMIEKTISASL